MSSNEQQTPPKIYLGNLQEKSRGTGDKFLTGSICLDDIENVDEEHIHHGKNGKRYLQIVVNPFKNGANAYGNTHSVAVDTFRAQLKKQHSKDTEPEVDGNTNIDNEFFK